MSPPTFTASVDEVRIAHRILDMVNYGKAATIDLGSATTIFTTHGIPRTQFQQIWTLTDRGSKGYLTKGELAAAIRLLGWVQTGRSVAEELITQPGPLPMLSGITEYISRKLPTPSSVQLMQRVSSITPREQPTATAFHFNHNETFKQAFVEGDPVNGTLNREQVLEIFVSKFTISFHHLSQVFELIDFSKRGALDIQEFCLGMHILEAFDSRSCLILPHTIPVEIQEELTRLQSSLAIPSTSIPSSKIDEDINIIRSQLSQKGFINGELLTRLKLRYDVQPVDIAQIWNSIPGYNSVPVAPATIEAAIQEIRKYLVRSPSRPVQHSVQSNFKKHRSVPDFANLTQRVASPVSSEYSSSTDTEGSASVVGVPPIIPFQISPIRDNDDSDDSCAHTDSSASSSPKWSRRHPTSYSGSCSSSYSHRLRRPVQEKSRANPRSAADMPVGNQYFTEEIQSLRAQLQEMQQRISTSLYTAKQSRHLLDNTGEVEKLNSALSQKEVQYNASRELLLQYQDATKDLEMERDGLCRIIDARDKENAKIRAELDQAKDDIKELIATTSSPTMRILFLRASLRQSQTETEQAQEQITNLQALVAAQETELTKLRNAKVTVQRDPTTVMLEEQMHGLNQLVELLLPSLNAGVKSIDICQIREEKHSSRCNVVETVFPSPAPESGYSDIPMSSKTDETRKKHCTDSITSKVELSLATPPETPELPHQNPSSQSPLRCSVGTSTAPKRTAPLYINKSQNLAPSSSKITLDSPPSASDPPAYVGNYPGYSGSRMGTDGKDAYYEAKERVRRVQGTGDIAPPASEAHRRPQESADANRETQLSDGLFKNFMTRPHRLDGPRPRPSRKDAAKTKRVQEWYEQEIGRLMARCENAQKLADKAREAEQHHCELACSYQDAMTKLTDDAECLRELVRAQRSRIFQLSGLIEGHGNLIVSNPDDALGSADHEQLHGSPTDPPSYPVDGHFPMDMDMLAKSYSS